SSEYLSRWGRCFSRRACSRRSFSSAASRNRLAQRHRAVRPCLKLIHNAMSDNGSDNGKNSGETASTVLSIQHITRNFGGLVAVNDVSFSVNKNEIFGLIGPNGAGKTTLFNIITGLTSPSRGTLIYNGLDYTGARPD